MSVFGRGRPWTVQLADTGGGYTAESRRLTDRLPPAVEEDEDDNPNYGSGSSFKRNAHIPFINILIGSSQNNSHSVSLTWRGGAPDYFSSLTHTRAVSKASTMHINLVYAPPLSGSADANIVERAILNGGGIIVVQYGDEASGVYSRRYKGMITDYSVEFEDGTLAYSIDAVSTACSYNLSKYHPSRGDSIDYKKDSSPIKAVLDVIKEAMDTMDDHYIYEREKSESRIISNVKSFKHLDLPPGEMPPVKYVIELVKRLECRDNKKFLAVEVDDTNQADGKGRVRIVLIDTTKTASQKQFALGTKTGTVISWKPSFKGAVGLAASRGQSGSDGINRTTNFTYSMYDPDTGNQITTNTDYNYLDQSNYTSTSDYLFVNHSMRTQQDFMRLAEYSYKASLTVLGEADDYQIGSSIIQVLPYIKDDLHHSAGLYVINGITDNVSSGGFTTTYDLQRRYTSGGEGSTDAVLYYSKPSDNDCKVWVDGQFLDYSTYDNQDQT